MNKSTPQYQTKMDPRVTDDALLAPRRRSFIQYDKRGIPLLSIYWQLGIMLWVSLFFLLFYAFFLPNNASISRLDIWQALLDLYLEIFFPSSDGSENPPSSTYKGWGYFPERLPLIGMVMLVLLAAWGYGISTLRLLKLESEFSVAERVGSGLALGLGILSLVTLFFGYFGMLQRWLLLAVILAPLTLEFYKHRQVYVTWMISPFKQLTASTQIRIPLTELIIGLIILLFIWTMLLGALLPETDFDVREYHLQGPKEFYQQGQITMLKHNVYTSFPFLTEMLSLLSMVLLDDWFYGSLVGKGVLMSYAPITALIMFGLARRVWSYEVGLYGALIFLTTPWIYRISIIAYTEGALCCYTIATLWACTRTIMLLLKPGQTEVTNEQPLDAAMSSGVVQLFSWSLLTGLLAGCAVSTKYPGLVTVTIPLCAAVMIVNFPVVRKYFQPISVQSELSVLKSLLTSFIGLTLGVCLTFGPWVIKNLYETGNPVYPLMYGIFGGEDLNPELVAKWKKGHAPDNYHWQDLGAKVVDVTLKSDWQSPLVFGLLPLAIVIPHKGRKLAMMYALYVFWYFAVWWVCTHRLDRFWVPLLPVASLVAGMGYSLLNGVARFHVTGLMLAAIVFNLGFITSTLCGNNSYLHSYEKSRELFAVRSIHKLEQLMKNQTGCVLSVGEAQVFDARYPIIYNTVFDESIFEKWCTISAPQEQNPDWVLRDPAEIKQILAHHQVKYILVNWQEILRYRETYGYTKFVTPKRFIWLQQQGIIGNAIDFTAQGEFNFRKLDSFRGDTQTVIKQDMPELLSPYRRSYLVRMLEYYPVVNTQESSNSVK